MFEGKLIEDEPDFVRIRSEELGGVIYVNHGISSPRCDRLGGDTPEKISLSRQPPVPAGGAHQPEELPWRKRRAGIVKRSRTW